MDSYLRLGRVQDLALAAAIRLLWILPERFIRDLACLVGWLLCELLRNRRRIIEGNVRIAFGSEIHPDRVAHISQQAWINLALTTVEVLLFPRRGERYLAELKVEGIDHIERSFSRGSGVILVVPHLGNWELGGAYLARRVPFAVIARPLKQESLARLLDNIRAEMGMIVIPRKSALKRAMGLLRRGGMVAFLLDQHAGKHGVPVPFFGLPAKTFISAASLALRTGASVHLAYTWRRPDGGLAGRISPALSVPVGADPSENVREATRLYTAAIEAAVREHPECWLWMHRRWRPLR